MVVEFIRLIAWKGMCVRPTAVQRKLSWWLSDNHIAELRLKHWAGVCESIKQTFSNHVK